MKGIQGRRKKIKLESVRERQKHTYVFAHIKTANTAASTEVVGVWGVESDAQSDCWRHSRVSNSPAVQTAIVKGNGPRSVRLGRGEVGSFSAVGVSAAGVQMPSVWWRQTW